MRILFIDLGIRSANFLKTIEPTTKKADCFFLEHRALTGADDYSPMRSAGHLVQWEEYGDALGLLKDIRPSKVVYVLLDDYYHIALCIAAKSLGIPICYIDHGIRFEHEMNIMNELEKSQQRLLYRIFQKSAIKPWLALRKNIFYRNTMNHLDIRQRKLARQLFVSRSKNYYSIFMREHGKDLRPDEIIAYSPETMSFYGHLFALPETWHGATYTGIPSLDSFITLQSATSDKLPRDVLFIDQPLHEQRLMGWTLGLKIGFLRELSDVVCQHGRHLYIKPHPLNEDYYTEVQEFGGDHLTIIGDLTTEVCRHIGFAGSFNSTLLLGFCAMQNVVTFCVEMHPLPVKPAFSYGITKYNIATAVHSFKDISHLFENPISELDTKGKALPNYVTNMLFAFDGMAAKRLNDAILSN